MSNDNKTLADVQPGGTVRLATVPYDRARDLMGDAYNAGTHGIGYSQQVMELRDAIFSSQPSPGGQGDLKSRFTEWVKANSYNPDTFASGRFMGDGVQIAWEAVQALSAHQPVGATEQPCNSGGIELTACQLHEALLMAGSPELDVPFEDRGRVRIFQNETGHSGAGLYCECVDAEEEGCILLDGSSPAIAPPTQTVDLDELRRAACVVNVVGQIDGHDVVRRNSVLDVIDTRRKRLSDSQAVGNG